MTKLLLKLFVKDKNTHSPAVRARIGSLSGIVGICANILLFGAKLFIGIISGSLSITADAMNNLTDAIKCWKEVLIYDPGFDPAVRGINAAEARLNERVDMENMKMPDDSI